MVLRVNEKSVGILYPVFFRVERVGTIFEPGSTFSTGAAFFRPNTDTDPNTDRQPLRRGLRPNVRGRIYLRGRGMWTGNVRESATPMLHSGIENYE